MKAAAQETKKLAETAQNLAAAAENALKQDEIPENAQKVKILRSHPTYAYFAGDEPELTPEHVEFLVSEGYAELLAQAETEI